jgi:hypothetical protein
MKNKFYKYLFIYSVIVIMVTACAPQNTQPIINTSTPQQPQSSAQPVNSPQPAISSSSNAPHVDVLDPTHLPLGDGKISSSPKRGYVYSCQTQFNGGGAEGNPSWIDISNSTWNLKEKISVNGSANWPQHLFTMTVQGGQRVFTTNDLPDHPTGTFPISSSDPAYKLDRNPNTIKAQSITFAVPATPAIAAQPTCVGGEVGIMLSGVLLFSAFDAEGRDAAAHEVQDQCAGHPQQGGYYHYHSLSPCLKDSATGQSALLGYAFDGFGIYGPYDRTGKELTDADLDECHGITSQVEWDGKKVVMYHYVATRDFPYVVGCFRGTPSVRALTAPAGQPSSGNPSQGGGNGQPPQAAINACINLSAGTACSFTAPNGQVNGTCQIPAQSSQLVCVPLGGPPNNP